VALEIVSPTQPWERIGLRIVDATASVGGIALRFRDPEPGEAVRIERWVLTDSPTTPDEIDGLATAHESSEHIEPQTWDHPLGATAFDHLVVMTSSLDRTCAAIAAATGEPLKRIRELGTIRQGFHRLGPMIIEVVESAQVSAPEASFWGFVLIVDDLEAVVERLGPELISTPKQAVQPGRMIASLRAGADLGMPIALMTR
jgi:hypothetical protein